MTAIDISIRILTLHQLYLETHSKAGMAILTKIWICFIFFRIFLLNVFVLTAIPHISVRINVTLAQNVTPCYDSHAYIIGIFNESLTWLEADYRCKQMGYHGLHMAIAGWQRWYHVRDVLQSVEFQENAYFWEGHFRPFFHIDEWYGVKLGKSLSCKEFGLGIISGRVDPFHQCAAVYWETFSTKQSLVSRSCSDIFPYICYQSNGLTYFHTYDGFVMSRNDLSSIRFIFNDSITTFNDCEQDCRDRVGCISFTFNYTSPNCTRTNIIYGNGPVTYEISPGFGNVTHGVKTGCNVTFSNTPNTFSISDIDPMLPDCGLSPIPGNYCQCASVDINTPLNDTQLEQAVQEIIVNLTVRRESTSARHRKLTSATDYRPSATVFGTIGTLILVVVFSLPIISDILTLKWKLHKRRKAMLHKENKTGTRGSNYKRSDGQNTECTTHF